MTTVRLIHMKAVPVHSLNAYRTSKGRAPLILKLSTRRKRVVNFKTWPPYIWEIKLVLTDQETRWAPQLILSFCKRDKSLVPPRIQNTDYPTQPSHYTEVSC